METTQTVIDGEVYSNYLPESEVGHIYDKPRKAVIALHLHRVSDGSQWEMLRFFNLDEDGNRADQTQLTISKIDDFAERQDERDRKHMDRGD